MKRSVACLLLLCASAALFAGCQDGGKAPARAKIGGTVTLDGKPLPEGELRFHVVGEPAIVLAVKDGVFAGDVLVGPNRVEVLWEVDGPPHPMDPSQRLKVNKVDARFSGPNSPFKQDVPPGGASDLSFQVTSAGK